MKAHQMLMVVKTTIPNLKVRALVQAIIQMVNQTRPAIVGAGHHQVGQMVCKRLRFIQP